MTVSTERLAADIFGGLEGLVRVPDSHCVARRDVRSVLLEKNRTIRFGGMPVADGIEHFDVELNVFEGVLRERPAVRDDDRDWLADIAHLAVRNDRLEIFLQARDGSETQRNGRNRISDVSCRYHGMDARNPQRRRGVDAANTAMRDRTAEDRRMERSGRLIIVRESPLACQKTQIFGALDRLSDERVRCGSRLGVNAHWPAPGCR